MGVYTGKSITLCDASDIVSSASIFEYPPEQACILSQNSKSYSLMIKGVVIAAVVIPQIAYCTGEKCIFIVRKLESVSTQSC